MPEKLYIEYGCLAGSDRNAQNGDIALGVGLGGELLHLQQVVKRKDGNGNPLPDQDTAIKYMIVTPDSGEWGDATITTGGMMTGCTANHQVVNGIEQNPITNLINVTEDDFIFWYDRSKEFDFNAATAAAQSARDNILGMETTTTAAKDNVLALEQAVISSKATSDSNAASIQANADTVNGVIAGLGAAFQKVVAQSANFVCAIPYDTTKDTDQGAWRHQCSHTGWFNEPLNTATRGATRKPPKYMVIAGETNKITIYDATKATCPMWMVFNVGAGHILQAGTVITSVDVYNGDLVIAAHNGTNGNFYRISLVKDTAQWGYSGVYGGTLVNSLADRNGTAVFDSQPLPQWYNFYLGCHDVALTAVPGAEIDPSTNLPYPTIGVGTNAGGIIINTDGTEANKYTPVNITSNNAGYAACHNIYFDDEGALFLSFSAEADNSYGYFYGFNTIPTADTQITLNNKTGTGQAADFYATTNPVGTEDFALVRENKDVDVVISAISKGAIGNEYGLTLALLDKSNPAISPYAYITTKYNTGWMRGSAGCWLCENTAQTFAGTELIANGGFDNATDWNLSAGVSATGELVFNSPGGYAQAVSTYPVVKGKTYHVTITTTAYTSGQQYFHAGAAAYPLTGGVLTQDFYLTATDDGFFYIDTGAGVASYDNLSVREAIPDRSVKGRSLPVYGNLPVTPAAPGCDTMMYGPFAVGVYAEQPYNPDLDFGAGDFHILYDLDSAADSYDVLLERNDIGLAGAGFKVETAGNNAIYVKDSANAIYVGSQNAYVPNKPTQIAIIREAGIIKLYSNDRLLASNPNTVNFTNTSAVLSLGRRVDGTTPADGSKLARLRMGPGAYTAEQLAKIYNDEKFLFRANAQATLGGTSDGVQSLGFDEDTGVRRVGKSDGVSTLRGLLILDHVDAASSLMTDNNIKSVAAVGGDVLIANGAEIYFDKEADEL